MSTGTDALVRPLAVAACDLDGGLVHGQVPFPGPFTLGHEFVGRVVAVGDDIAHFRPGDLVASAFQVSCGACRRCRRGQSDACERVPRTSMFGVGGVGGDWGGAFADLVRTPWADHLLVRLPPGVDPVAAAAASDNVADGWRGVGPALERDPGAEVLVVAGGPPNSVSLFAAHCAVALGSGRVRVATRDAGTAALAEQLGAEPVLLDAWPRRLDHAPIVVDGSNSPEGLACALRSTDPGGVCTSVSIYFGDVPVPLFDMYMKGITFETGRVRSHELLPKMIELIAAGTLRPQEVITEVAEWDDAVDALLGYRTKLVVHRDR